MACLPANGRRRRPSKAAAVALSVVLGAGLLGACGGGGSDASGAGEGGETESSAPTPTIPLPADQPQRPACGLISQAEVEAAIGARVGPGRQQNDEGRSVCSFPLAASADQSVAVMSTSSSGVPAAFEAARKNMAGQPLNAGDQAFVAGGQALVRKGSTMVAVLVFLRQEPAQLASAATKLAQSVATHL